VPTNSLGKAVKWHSDAKRIEAVTTYLVLGKSNLVEAAIGVPQGTIRQWKLQPWWDELVHQIQTESDLELDAKLAKRIEKSLDLVNDRLENGDFLYDPKTGSFVRKPVNIRDGWKISSEMIDKRWLIRKMPKEQTSEGAVGDILKTLAAEFATMAKRRLKEVVIDGEVLEELKDGSAVEVQAELPDGIRQIPGETSPNQEQSGAQPSPV